jgi:hypothetical protein
MRTSKIQTTAKPLLLLSCLLLRGTTTQAQDTHYWNLQYGTGATLLGGAVIGSVSDLSATYYNPGAVALFQDPRFIVSAKIYEANHQVIRNGAGKGLDLSNTSITPSPSFFAAALKLGWLKDDQLAVSILTRQKYKFEVSGRRIDSLEVLPDSPGKEDFAGGISIDQDVDELWFGLTWAHKLSSNIGLGITPNVAYRSQESTRLTVIQILQTDGEAESLTSIKKIKYQNYRLLVKGGMGFNFNPLTLGFTVTTPSVNLLGKGSVGNHFFLTGRDLDGDGQVDNQFASNYQDGVESGYPSSWAVGAGGSYRLGKVRIHLSTEWFDAVEEFDVLQTKDFAAQSSGETITNALTHELKSVVNYGMGIEIQAGERSIVSLGFVTDFSAHVPDSQTNLSSSIWDFYHFSGGASFTVGKSEVTLGLAYAFANEPIRQFINLPDSKVGATNEAEYVTNRFKLLFGFNF